MMGSGCPVWTHIKAESFTPCCSASALDVAIVLLFILEVHFRFQSDRLAPPERAPSTLDTSDSDSEGLFKSPGRLPVGLVGRGENVP